MTPPIGVESIRKRKKGKGQKKENVRRMKAEGMNAEG
jgi:hypothetical protein